MTVAPRAWSQADSGTQALRVGSRMTVTAASSGILAHRRSRSAVVVRNFHDDQMNSPRSSARLARWSARQATSMPNLTSLMAWSFRWTIGQSALRCRPLHVPQGCDHPDIQKQGSDSLIDRRVPEKGCTCVGRLVWSTITVVESSCCSLRPPKSQARRTDPTHPTKGFRQIGGCPEPTLNSPLTPIGSRRNRVALDGHSGRPPVTPDNGSRLNGHGAVLRRVPVDRPDSIQAELVVQGIRRENENQ